MIFGLIITVPAKSYAADNSRRPVVHIGPRANTYGDPAKGIYVSPNGNDSKATGSVNAPYKSINAALGAANPGDTVILRGGTYREGINVRIRKPNITIKSAKGEWAIIDLTTHDRGHDEDSGVYFDVESSGGKLQCVEVKGGFYAVCFETTWDWGLEYYPTRYGASNIIVEDCILHDSKYEIVKVKPNCNNITIRYNEIYNSARAEFNTPDWFMGEAHGEAIDNVNGKNMTAQNNYMHDLNIGIYAKGGAADALIENNRIENAYGAGIQIGFDTSPEWFDTKTNPKYYENIRCVVRNNLIINTGWEGIGLYASKDAEVYNNTIINAVSYGKALYHSAIYFGIVTQDWANESGCPSNINPNIHHNIVNQSNNSASLMVDIRYATGIYPRGLSALDGNPAMHDNCYYIAGKSATFNDNRPRSILENAGLSLWQSHIKGDERSLETDPMLDFDYMPSNPKCAGMGLTSPLTVTKNDTSLTKLALKNGEPRNGDIIGDVLYSDITAYINNKMIPTCVIKGKTLVVVEDLARYGFDVKWDGAKRTLNVELNKNKKFDPISMPAVKDTKNKTGAFKCKYLYTDIKTYLSGKEVESFAIDGVTLIDFELLAKYGKLSWNEKTREIRVVIE